MRELEFAGLDSVRSFLKRKASHFTPEPGAKCANCETELTGLYCHACGQAADNHHRSIGHLILEGFEGVFHMDSRLWRTLPPLFLNPGLLARDYMTGRLARHVPPFRTFLVSLLLFIFAAESVIHHMGAGGGHGAQPSHGQAEQGHAPTSDNSPAKLMIGSNADPKTTAALVKARLAEAAADRDEQKAEAAKDRDEALKGAKAEAERTKILATYEGKVKKADNKYAAAVKNPEAIAMRSVSLSDLMRMTPAERHALAKEIQGDEELGKISNLKQLMIKAFDNPQLFMLNLFTWGHRLAVLLLPIMTLVLAVLYVYRRKFYIFDHFLVACNILSFMFLTNAFGFILPEIVRGWWFLLLMVWTPVNIFMTLKGAYESGIFGALIKTVILWTATTVSFGLLLLGLAWVAVNSM